MRNFLRAILNEWKQHWRPLLLLFVAEALLFLVRIFINEYISHYGESYLLSLLILYCAIPVIMAPNLLTASGASDNAGICCKEAGIDRLIARWKFLCLALPIAALYGLWLLITNSFQYWGINPLTAIGCFVLLMLLGIVFVAWLAAKYLTSCSLEMLYWTKFIAGLILFIFPIFTILTVALISNGLPSDKICYEATIIVLSVASGIYVLFFFIAGMMPKTRRPLVFVAVILTILLLLLLFAPGIIGGISLFGNDALIKVCIENVTNFSFKGSYEGTPGFLAGCAMIVFLSIGVILLPPLGYWLWARKIIRGEKYLKSLFVAIGLLVLASIILWIIAVTAGLSALHQAESDARDAGILYEPEQLLAKLPPVPDERNAASMYCRAYEILNDVNKYNGDLYWHALKSLQSKEASIESRQHLVALVQSPEGKQIYTLLEQAAAYPECRFAPKNEKREIKLFEFEMHHIAEFILARACVFKLTGQEDRILPEIEKSLKIAQIINNEQFQDAFIRNRFIVEDAMTEAIKIGQDNPAAVTSYRRMLEYLNRHPTNYIRTNMEPEYCYFSTLLKLQSRFDEGQLRSCEDNYFYKILLWNDLLAGYPLVARYFSNYINDCVKVRREMLKIREMPILTPELSGLLNDYSSYDDYNYLLRTNLKSLFEFRSAQAMLKIGLALKIYKCEHGKYPASLQELVPAILPEIPVDPLGGKPFGYKVKDGNFTLTNNAKYPKELSSELKPTN